MSELQHQRQRLIGRGGRAVGVVHASAAPVPKPYFPDVPKRDGILSATWSPAGTTESLATPPKLLRTMETDRIGSS